jgi:hypothetical protein
MNILSSHQASGARPKPTVAPQIAAATTQAVEQEEPKDGFSLTKTLSVGLLGFMGRRIPSTQPEISPQKMEELKEKIKPGDVLMSADMSYPGWARMEYWAIGSEYTHAALMGNDGKVYEAVGEGVIETSLETFLEGRKKIAVARHGLTEADAAVATEYAKSHLGKAYDGVFNYGDDKEFYCSELVAKSLAQIANPIEVPHGKIFGKDAIAPDVFLKMKGAEVVHDDKSNYWGNKVAYWPIAASTAALGVAGHLLGGGAGAAIGAGAGFLGSILVGNKIQTGHFSPSLVELSAGKH